MSENHTDDLVKTSDQLDEQAKKHDASAQEEDQAPGHPLETDSGEGSNGSEGEDTVSEEVAKDLPGAAFQK